MQMMNRAIEGASDFREMMRKLEAGHDQQRAEVHALTRPNVSPKRLGENREQYRARLRAESKVRA